MVGSFITDISWQNSNVHYEFKYSLEDAEVLYKYNVQGKSGRAAVSEIGVDASEARLDILLRLGPIFMPANTLSKTWLECWACYKQCNKTLIS